MSTLEALLFFGGGTLLLVVVISLLAVVPSIARGPRYRPGQEWWAEPSWFGGPTDEPRELAEGSEGQERRRLEAPTRSGDQLVEAAPQRTAGGGAGARW